MNLSLSKVGRNLECTVKAYNETVKSLDNRVLPGVRRFKELGAGGGDEIESLEQLDTLPRALAVL
jgi:DNA recombination protein RmuC